ncbi:FAD-dependent oxidoreductase, partial [bacterium]|nr:FAD-dependent oxidoreductase [bacterium]
IATGSSPIIPPAWQEFKKYFVDTDLFFELEQLPKSMAVLGIGVIGIEIGQALHRLGVDSVSIGRRKVIGGLSDPKLREYSAIKFAEEMKIDFSGVQSMHEENHQLVIKTADHSYRVDKALVAVGRKVNIDSLALDQLDIPLLKNGVPHYSKETFQIENFLWVMAMVKKPFYMKRPMKDPLLDSMLLHIKVQLFNTEPPYLLLLVLQTLHALVKVMPP